ncbi:hypothetical protein [Mesorhizobium sp. M7A.F.Ca.MR.362.00.0.0]|uniref:hypothetical protein n=1 Tax=Mesorhizobium sp. M7A.F.Ca.MR.362.00.0.0 TaxID=2496779 RepID=UPI000FD4D8B7|nr:hypothetical protein [Mesorhizobium sp. M7A.F.Ca.MR.362.00.0.0]RUU81296.1 hypothetical protein EOC06_08810 [Mesorhizobium sp. M7A.F.Ca.MR.362.00.0.0]
MSARKVGMMTEDELIHVIRAAVREEFSAAGMRVDAPADVDEARRDFMFLRRLRGWVDGTASKIGGAIILAVVSGIVWLIVVGAQAFFNKP